MRDSRHHCVGAARPDRCLVCRTWVDAFLIFNLYLWFILWFHIIAWLFINSLRSINHMIYDLLWFMLFMMPPPAASLLPGALVPLGAPGHPIPAAGARCLLPSSRQGLLPCHGDSCPSHSCNCCPLPPRGPPLPSRSYFRTSGHAQDVLWPVCLSGAGDKCLNPPAKGWSGWP